MRGFIRTWFLYVVALYLLDKIFAFISVGSMEVLVAAATMFYILNTIGKPILKVLWLPINIVTLGLFSWVINAIVVFVVIFLIPGFVVTPFTSSAIRIGKLLIPEIHLQLIPSYFFFTFMLSWTIEFLWWLLIDD